MHPFQFQPPHEANSPPSSGDRRTNFQRRRPGLSIPIPYRDPTTAVPLPLPLPPRRPTPSPLPPINFSDLEQLNYIGSGRGGTVYSALHRPTNKLYALKIIAGAHEPDQRKHIQSEVRILRSVDHPNVIKCYDDMYDENDSKIQVLLEFMDAGSLNGARIISEATLANVTKQILTGLVYLHSMRIVHRDIKPSNLLTNSKNEVKIADFGVSRILSRTMDPCNSSVGTIVYMSPERINTVSNDGQYDGYAGDVWSLGICVLEFYLGTLPFKGITKESADWASLVWAICMSTPPAAPPNSSSEFQDFINCCLRSNPTERWTAARLLQHPFIVMYGDATPASAGGGGGNHQGRQSVYQQYASSSSYN